MNQKVVNVILAAGIAILLFLQLRPVNQAPVAASPVSGTAVKLGYVDLDSVQERYLLYKEKMDMFDKKKEDKRTIEDLQDLVDDLTEDVKELNLRLDEAIASNKAYRPAKPKPAKPRAKRTAKKR